MAATSTNCTASRVTCAATRATPRISCSALAGAGRFEDGANLRDFFRLAGSALWVTAGAAACARGGGTAIVRAPADPVSPDALDLDVPNGFLMRQISDTHWGYSGPANPDPRGTIERAIDEISGAAKSS